MDQPAAHITDVAIKLVTHDGSGAGGDLDVTNAALDPRPTLLSMLIEGFGGLRVADAQGTGDVGQNDAKRQSVLDCHYRINALSEGHER